MVINMDNNCLDFNENFILCYEKYKKSVRNYLNRYVFQFDDSEELTQDVFLKVLEKGKDLDPDSARVKNFIFTIARNKAIDFIKRRKTESVKYNDSHMEEVAFDKQFYKDIENMYIEGEIISTINDTINSFPEIKRDLFIEKNFNDKKLDVLSGDFKISKYKIKKIDKEVRSKIKCNLSEYEDDL